MKLLLKLAPYIIIIGLAIYIVITHERPVPGPDPQTTDIVYTDSLAILVSKVDSLESDVALRLANLDRIRKTQLTQQRNYYENQIRRTRGMPADSALCFFTAHTSGIRGHRGSGSD